MCVYTQKYCIIRKKKSFILNKISLKQKKKCLGLFISAELSVNVFIIIEILIKK
jgi:hypothetical protein